MSKQKVATYEQALLAGAKLDDEPSVTEVRLPASLLRLSIPSCVLDSAGAGVPRQVMMCADRCSHHLLSPSPPALLPCGATLSLAARMQSLRRIMRS